MKLVRYAAFALIVATLFYAFVRATSDEATALGLTVCAVPLALWTGRLVDAKRRGRITRRMPMLDGGPRMSGVFWSFRPDVYERRGGFDHFTGYFVKEALLCIFAWAVLLSISIASALGH